MAAVRGAKALPTRNHASRAWCLELLSKCQIFAAFATSFEGKLLMQLRGGHQIFEVILLIRLRTMDWFLATGGKFTHVIAHTTRNFVLFQRFVWAQSQLQSRVTLSFTKRSSLVKTRTFQRQRTRGRAR